MSHPTGSPTQRPPRAGRDPARRFRAAIVTLVVAGLLACTTGLAQPAGADDPLTLSVSPSTLTTQALTQPQALEIRLSCPTTLGQVTVTMLQPGRTVPTNLLTNYGVGGSSMTFYTSMSPALAGDYVFSASSTLCGTAASTTVTVTGDDIDRKLTASTTRQSVEDFATTGITFTGVGFTPGAVVTVSSLVPGTGSPTVTVDPTGSFTYTQIGAPDTPPGHYETHFTSPSDGGVGITFSVGTPVPTPPGGPQVAVTPTTVRRLVYMTTGVSVDVTDLSPSDLVTITDVGPTGATYVRATGKPAADGTFHATFGGTNIADADRVGQHTVTVSTAMTAATSHPYEVVADPPLVATADPDPVPAGSAVTFRATPLLPNVQYLLYLDESVGSTILATTDADGTFTWTGTIPASYTQGPHVGTLYPIGIAVTSNPTLTFTVGPPAATTTTSSSSTSTSTSTSTTTSTSTSTSTTSTTTTTEPPTTSTTTTEPPTTSTTVPPTTSTTTTVPPPTSTTTTEVPTSSTTTSTSTTMAPSSTTIGPTTSSTSWSTTSPSSTTSTVAPVTPPTSTPPSVEAIRQPGVGVPDDPTVHVSKPTWSVSGAGALPATGTDIGRWVLLGLGTALLGFALVGTATLRRRHRF